MRTITAPQTLILAAVMLSTACAPHQQTQSSTDVGTRTCELRLASQRVLTDTIVALGNRLSLGMERGEVRDLIGDAILHAYWQDFSQCAKQHRPESIPALLTVDEEIETALTNILDLSRRDGTGKSRTDSLDARIKVHDEHLKTLQPELSKLHVEKDGDADQLLPAAPPLTYRQWSAEFQRGNSIRISATLESVIAEAVTGRILNAAKGYRDNIVLFLNGHLHGYNLLDTSLGQTYRGGRDFVDAGHPQ